MEQPSPELVVRLAALVGAPLPPADIEPLAARLQAMAALLQPILELDLADVPSALGAGPEWD